MKVRLYMKVRTKNSNHPLGGQILLVNDILGKVAIVKLSKKTKPYIHYQYEKVSLEWLEKECEEVE